jgi:GH15 family glucan-1,4-alpha-glucosidase
VPLPAEIDAEQALTDTENYWLEWADKCGHRGDYHDEIHQSLMVLKALTYQPTGGIVAAPTTSLPEEIGGPRNWDYRYCWLRDSTLTLVSMLNAGYNDEARAWRSWLLRAVAGDPGDLQIMYGIAGERRLDERELEWLPGFEGSVPVRVGNAASRQLQLDVYGEVLDAAYQTLVCGVDQDDNAWSLARILLTWLEDGWRQPDAGIWEVRGPLRHFTHSKVMSWVAFDRAVRMCDEFGAAGPADRWRALRTEIHAEVLARGWSEAKQSFTQSFDSDDLDASSLLMPTVGFLDAADPRFASTVEAIRRELTVDGLLQRYLPRVDGEVDGILAGEGVFLPCSFWLADALALQGRHGEARELFERLLDLRNDVGLLSEEYDPVERRQLGNFPQAFTHLALVNTALVLGTGRGVRPAPG